MAKFIKSKFRVLWGTVFSFFAGLFATDVTEIPTFWTEYAIKLNRLMNIKPIIIE